MAGPRPILIVLALLATACSSSESSEPAASETPIEPRQVWSEQRPDRYRLTTRIVCFCFELPAWMDIVEGDESVDHLELLTGTRESFGPTGPRTMESLYDYADELAAEFDLVTVETRPETGAIVSIAVDPLPDSKDDEWTLDVEMDPLRPDEPGAPAILPADVELSSLDQPLECRHLGLTNSAGLQSLLVVHHETPPIDPDYREVVLPHNQWEVRVVVGETERGAGCESAQSPDRVAEAHAVGGRLTVVEPGEQVCDEVEIRIDDLTIEDGRGGRTPLGSVTVRGVFNWACDFYG